MSDITTALAVHLESETDHDVTAKAHSVVIDGDFEMFGGAELKGEISAFFARRMDVSAYTVSVEAPPGELTGSMVVEDIEVVPNA